MTAWSDLSKDIVTKIGEHLDFYEDVETLQCICKNWRSAATNVKFRACVKDVRGPLLGQEHTLPWLMLSDMNICHLYSLTKHMVRHINLPNSVVSKNDKITLLSSFGWLLVASGRTNPSLFYPFSGAIKTLPIVKFRCNQHRGLRSYYWHEANEYKFILSANPVTTSSYTVFLSLFTARCTPASILVYWRSGTKNWIQVLDPDPSPTSRMPSSMNSFGAFLASSCQDITYYQGEFYAVNSYNMIVKFGTAQRKAYFQEVTNRFALLNNDGEKWSYYLVEFGCQLLVVRQVIWLDKINIRCETKRFDVFELNVQDGNVREVSCLGNRAIFLGVNSSFSVEITSLAHGFKPNCIYYSDDRGKRPTWKGRGRDGKDHCLYNLMDKKVERSFYNGHSSHVGTQFMWLESPLSLSKVIIQGFEAPVHIWDSPPEY